MHTAQKVGGSAAGADAADHLSGGTVPFTRGTPASALLEVTNPNSGSPNKLKLHIIKPLLRDLGVTPFALNFQDSLAQHAGRSDRLIL